MRWRGDHPFCGGEREIREVGSKAEKRDQSYRVCDRTTSVILYPCLGICSHAASDDVASDVLYVTRLRHTSEGVTRDWSSYCNDAS